MSLAAITSHDIFTATSIKRVQKRIEESEVINNMVNKIGTYERNNEQNKGEEREE